MSFLLLVLIGILGGISSGLFGVGGGTIFVPMLILVRGFDPHLAIGTSLAVVVPTAMIGALTHGKASMVDWKSALVIALFALLGAWLGSVLSLRLDALLLRRLFAVFLMLVAVKLFFPN